jgi:sulfatase maturation enzyme AslB (radical SAM superfamily)
VLLNQEILDWIKAMNSMNDLDMFISLDDIVYSKMTENLSVAKETLKGLEILADSNISFDTNMVLDTKYVSDSFQIEQYVKELLRFRDHIKMYFNVNINGFPPQEREKTVSLFKATIDILYKNDFYKMKFCEIDFAHYTEKNLPQ